ncbi:MAG: zinc-binding dehydrogenase [Lactobacillus sp.]|jgi:NADPH2:quinone reductase|nr:zinc-binding dehydrogenase [Lactobacillus sp.]MCI2032667.1 zinc-binding dehydrogenase [Lactobacillus sp.]
MQALYFETFGSPEVLQYGPVSDPVVAADTVLVKTTNIGLNFADIYRRRGTYHIEQRQPYIDGYEAVGRVVALGSQVHRVALGDRILAVDVPFANAELVAIPQANAIPIPADISDVAAASVGLQGLTADFLAHDLAQNKAGERVLIHGISGGVGQLLTQILVADGVAVYGVASSAQKQAIGERNGATAVFRRGTDWATTHTDWFDTVFDGVGSTLATSFAVTKHLGKVVFYGMAGGDPPPVEPVKLLAASKSLLTGDLWDYLTSSQARQTRAERLFDYLRRGQVAAPTPTIFKLRDGRAAHEALESGHSIGKILLQP